MRKIVARYFFLALLSFPAWPCLAVALQNKQTFFLSCVQNQAKPWLPEGCGQIFKSYVLGPSGFWTMAPLHYTATFDPFLSYDCAAMPSTLAQSKERKGSNFAIWQP